MLVSKNLSRHIFGRLVAVSALWGVRLFSSAANLILMALATRVLGVNSFADFSFYVGLVAWIPILDFGFGSVLQNKILKSNESLSEASKSMFVCACSALLIALPFLCLLMVAAILRVDFLGGARNGHLWVTVVLVLVTCGITSLLNRFLFALEKITLSALLSLAQSVAGLFGFYIASRGSSLQIETAVLSYYIPFAFIYVFSFVWFIRYSRIFSFPSWVDIRVLFRRASGFWLITLLSLAVVQADQIVGFFCLSASDYGRYVIATKIVGFAYFPVSALLATGWNSMGKACAQNNASKVRGILKANLAVGAAMIVVCLGVLLLASPLVQMVFKFPGGGNYRLLIVSLCLLSLVKLWTDSFALVLQSSDITMVIIRYLPFQAIASVCSQVLLVRVFGEYGLIMGCAISYFITSHWILPIAVSRFVEKFNGVR